jgi:hypothetical protein
VQAASDPAPSDEAEAAPTPRRRGRPPRAKVAETRGEDLLDAAVLPPAIARADNDGGSEAEAPAAPRKRGRPRRATAEAAE